MSQWDLECLLCGATPTSSSVDQERRREYGDLVALQTHGMIYHELTQEDFIKAERIPPFTSARIEVRVYKWRLPSGQLWLRAIKKEEVRRVGQGQATPSPG